MSENGTKQPKINALIATGKTWFKGKLYVGSAYRCGIPANSSPSLLEALANVELHKNAQLAIAIWNVWMFDYYVWLLASEIEL